MKFAQPNANSAVLNRVAGTGGMSQISGNLTANGQVFLINPNGILFGNGARVNVNTLVASSLDITDNLFNQGFYRQVGAQLFPVAVVLLRLRRAQT